MLIIFKKVSKVEDSNLICNSTPLHIPVPFAMPPGHSSHLWQHQVL